MSKKIIGVTVGTTLPKPNFKQDDPTKGDYIRNKPDFDGLKNKVDSVSSLVGDTEVSKQIENFVANKLIPACTTSDNGKLLCVVDGVAAWASIPNAEGDTF